MSVAAVQKHVAILERVGLLTKRRRGREQLAGGEVDAVRSGQALLEQFETLWRARIDRIDELVTGDDSTPETQGDRPCP